jgi:hypothetical protein
MEFSSCGKSASLRWFARQCFCTPIDDASAQMLHPYNTHFDTLYGYYCAVAVSFVDPLDSLCVGSKKPLLDFGDGVLLYIFLF